MGDDFFRNLVEEIRDEDTTIMADGLGSAEFTGYIDTGCLALNALVSGNVFGGIPNNSGTAIVGDPATGKTFFILGIIGGFLKADPTAGAALWETESAIRKAMVEARGLDSKRIIRGEPTSLEDFRYKVITFLDLLATKKKRPPIITALDSLGMLPSVHEIATAVADKEADRNKKDMSKAGIIKGIFRLIRLKMARLQVPMLVTNHVYAGIGQYAPPKVIAGGSGLIYTSDTIVMLKKKKLTEGTDVVGNLITAKTFKSRLSRENQEVELKLSYDYGLDKYYGLKEIAEEAGIFKKVSTKYELPDGSKVYGKEIDETPEQVYTQPLLEELNDYVGRRFQYGSEYESNKARAALEKEHEKLVEAA